MHVANGKRGNALNMTCATLISEQRHKHPWMPFKAIELNGNIK